MIKITAILASNVGLLESLRSRESIGTLKKRFEIICYLNNNDIDLINDFKESILKGDENYGYNIFFDEINVSEKENKFIPNGDFKGIDCMYIIY